MVITYVGSEGAEKAEIYLRFVTGAGDPPPPPFLVGGRRITIFRKKERGLGGAAVSSSWGKSVEGPSFPSSSEEEKFPAPPLTAVEREGISYLSLLV